ncbi:MAG: ADP-ribosylglycohydrolase family protein [Sandaracinaceae bacterium]|nr:ADP-ribosylglycohydrolase family protein [Sandaracinaceae bacterium]
MGERGQLDLLGGIEPRIESKPSSEAGVRWLALDGAGKVGRAPLSDGSGMRVLVETHKVDVLVAIATYDPARASAAKEAGLDLRPLDPDAAVASWHAQVEALYADLRAGRRAIVSAADDSDAALLAASLLVALGRSKDEAIAAVSREAIGEAKLARLSAFALAHAREDAPVSSVGRIAAPQLGMLDEEPAEAAAREPDAEGEALEDDWQEAFGEDEDPADEAAGEEAGDAEADEPREARREPDEKPKSISVLAKSLEEVARSPRAARYAGAVLGGASGDAMGHPTEFVGSFEAIRKKWPPSGVERFELYWERDGKRFAPYTDDTQMAEQVLRALLWGREQGADLDATMRHMAKLFVEWGNAPQGGHRAPGNACLAGCRNLAKGVPWAEAGGERAGGCGSVMRAYPFGLLFASDLVKCEAWSVAHSKLTHRDPIALAASAAMAVGVARIVRDEPLDLVLSEMVAAACRYSPSTAAMMARAIDEAQQGVEPETTLQRLQGWAAHEAIAAAVYVLARHPDDPRAAILEGANTPGDSDSIATLAGSLVGARVGVGALPSEWARDVERTDELLALACAI